MNRPQYVLINGTVYRRARRWYDGDLGYLRWSVPPDFRLGKRSKAKVRYSIDKLPDHEVITEERAIEIQKTGMARFEELVRSRKERGRAIAENLGRQIDAHAEQMRAAADGDAS